MRLYIGTYYKIIPKSILYSHYEYRCPECNKIKYISSEKNDSLIFCSQCGLRYEIHERKSRRLADRVSDIFGENRPNLISIPSNRYFYLGACEGEGCLYYTNDTDGMYLYMNENIDDLRESMDDFYDSQQDNIEYLKKNSIEFEIETGILIV